MSRESFKLPTVHFLNQLFIHTKKRRTSLLGCLPGSPRENKIPDSFFEGFLRFLMESEKDITFMTLDQLTNIFITINTEFIHRINATLSPTTTQNEKAQSLQSLPNWVKLIIQLAKGSTPHQPCSEEESEENESEQAHLIGKGGHHSEAAPPLSSNIQQNPSPADLPDALYSKSEFIARIATIKSEDPLLQQLLHQLKGPLDLPNEHLQTLEDCNKTLENIISRRNRNEENTDNIPEPMTLASDLKEKAQILGDQIQKAKVDGELTLDPSSSVAANLVAFANSFTQENPGDFPPDVTQHSLRVRIQALKEEINEIKTGIEENLKNKPSFSKSEVIKLVATFLTKKFPTNARDEDQSSKKKFPFQLKAIITLRFGVILPSIEANETDQMKDLLTILLSLHSALSLSNSDSSLTEVSTRSPCGSPRGGKAPPLLAHHPLFGDISRGGRAGSHRKDDDEEEKKMPPSSPRIGV